MCTTKPAFSISKHVALIVAYRTIPKYWCSVKEFSGLEGNIFGAVGTGSVFSVVEFAAAVFEAMCPVLSCCCSLVDITALRNAKGSKAVIHNASCWCHVCRSTMRVLRGMLPIAAFLPYDIRMCVVARASSLCMWIECSSFLSE